MRACVCVYVSDGVYVCACVCVAQEKVAQDVQQLREDDASLRQHTEQLARELALKMQHTFQVGFNTPKAR